MKDKSTKLFGKIGSTAKALWAKLDDPTPSPNAKTTPKQDELEVAAAAAKKVLSPLSPVTDKAKESWHKPDDPMTPSSTKTENEILTKQDRLEAVTSVSQNVHQNTHMSQQTQQSTNDELYTVCTLRDCESPEIQANISKTKLKSRVQFQLENGRKVGVYCNNLKIGILPASKSELFFEDKILLASLVGLENQSTFISHFTIPKIRVFLRPHVKKLLVYPFSMNGHPVFATYRLLFSRKNDINIEKDILGNQEKVVDATLDGERIILSYNDIIFGYIEDEEKVAIASEFDKEGLPYNAILLENAKEVYLRFYKDKRFGNEWREQTVHKLTSYKSKSKQETISFLNVGDELELEEDYGSSSAVIVSYCGDPIGKLPKKAASRFLKDDAYGAFVEELEPYEDDWDFEERYIPCIRIYWNNKDVSNLGTQITHAQAVHHSGGSAMNSREHKGSSIIALPDNYVVIDIETTGLDFLYDDIIEISAIRYTNNIKTEEFSTLVNPERPIPEFITELTGITNQMVADAPTIEKALPEFMNFVGSSLLVGQNVAFDVNFLYDAASDQGLPAFANDHINIMRIARKVYPDLGSYRLGNIAAACSVPYKGAHRSLADCEITAACYNHLKGKVLETMSEAEFADMFKKKGESGQSYADFIASMNLEGIEANEDSPIFGKTVVFTGELERMKRKEALTLVAQLGGVPADSITKKVNYLVVGNAEFAHSVKNGRTSKMKKAEALALKGNDINIISEDTFFQMIDEK